MGGDLVEEDERRQARSSPPRAGRGPEPIRRGAPFVLPSRPCAADGLFGAVRRAKITRLRARPRCAAAAVARRMASNAPTINVFGFQRRAGPHQSLDIALQGDIRPWKGRGFIPRLRNERRKPRYGLEPRGRNRDGEFGGFPFDRVEPAAVGAGALLQQTVAAA